MNMRIKRTKNVISNKWRKRREILIFLLPWIIGFSIFFAYPLYKSFFISFGEITEIVGIKAEWIGFANYKRALFSDISFVPNLLSVIKDTAIDIPILIVLALFIAILLNKGTKGKGFFRVICFLPFILGTGFVMKTIIGLGVDDATVDVSKGIIIPYDILTYLSQNFADVVQGFLSRIAVIMWKSSVQILILLGALQTVPESLYESSECDGATEWEKFWLITFPMILPQLFMVLVYSLIDSFTDSNNVLIQDLIENSFNMDQYEFMTAKAWIYMIFIIISVSIVLVLSKKGEKNTE